MLLFGTLSKVITYRVLPQMASLMTFLNYDRFQVINDMSCGFKKMGKIKCMIKISSFKIPPRHIHK